MENVIDLYSNNLSYLPYGDADFEIAMKPLHFNFRDSYTGNFQSSRVNKLAVVRTDTNQCLGVVGPRYKAINHRDMIDNQRAIIARSSLNTDGITEKIVTDRNGARCYVKHTLPNQFLKTPDGDTAALTFLGVNSFDGLFSFMLSAGARQSACMNGQIFTEGSSTIYKSRHTRQLDIHQGAQIVGKGLQVMMQQNELWKAWYHTVPSEQLIKAIFSDAAGIDPNDENVTKNKNYLYMWQVFAETYRPRQGNNLWAVYNALTDWATHAPSMKKSSSPIVTLQNRRANKVSKVISNDFYFRQAAA